MNWWPNVVTSGCADRTADGSGLIPALWHWSSGQTSPSTRSTAFDRTITVTWVGSERNEGFERLTWSAVSTLWRKRLYLDVHQAHAEFHAEVHGIGDIDSIRYFDAIPDAHYVPHFPLTKHFNDKGQTDAREHSVGSPVRFRSIFCPEPNSHNRQFLDPHEYAQISVNADLDAHGGNFIANPGPLCFALGDRPRSRVAGTRPGRPARRAPVLGV